MVVTTAASPSRFASMMMRSPTRNGGGLGTAYLPDDVGLCEAVVAASGDGGRRDGGDPARLR